MRASTCQGTPVDLIECPWKKGTHCIRRHRSEHGPWCGHMVWVAPSMGGQPKYERYAIFSFHLTPMIIPMCDSIGASVPCIPIVFFTIFHGRLNSIYPYPICGGAASL